ncbi:MAG TPA: hypothetical protein DDW65_03660, partial [Firmicutes bacterium]|nr:hypothetical protein [Bacillota bacterium]
DEGGIRIAIFEMICSTCGHPAINGNTDYVDKRYTVELKRSALYIDPDFAWIDLPFPSPPYQI